LSLASPPKKSASVRERLIISSAGIDCGNSHSQSVTDWLGFGMGEPAKLRPPISLSCVIIATAQVQIIAEGRREELTEEK